MPYLDLSASLKTYVMGLRPLEIILLLQRGDRL